MPERDALRRAIFEHASDAMLLVDDDATVIDANAAASELFGRPRSEVIGRQASSFAAPDDREGCAERLRAALAQGVVRGEVRIERADGAIRIAEFVLSGGLAPGRHLVTLRDVTERRAREEEAERYRVLWNRARDIVLFIDREGRILDANDAAVEAYGRSRQELRSMRIADLRAPETVGLVPRQMDEAFDRGVLFETVHLRKDGTRFPVEVNSRATTIAGKRVLLSVIRDIAERKQMHARLVQADRLASVGTLAAGVAHEINNPLTYAMSSVELALSLLRSADGASVPRERIVDLLATALHGTQRVAEIVRDLKMLARHDDERTAVDVRAVLDSCLDVARHELRHGVRWVRAYDPVPCVWANESRLAQVFLNLIVNAAHAVRARPDRSGTIRIETRTDAQGRAVVCVSDDGIGIAASMLPRIFDAFVTTKRAGEGTGLGLFLSRSIVHELGGTIEARSEPGRGATFTVTLPPTDEAPRPRGANGTPRPSRRARILLVDDEISIGRVLRAALEREHELVVLTSAEAAIDWLADDDRFDLVLSDVSMHGTGGLDLLRHVRARHPALARRFVLMTGGASAAGAPLDGGEVPVLDKPFTVEALRALVARVLEPDGVAGASAS